MNSPSTPERDWKKKALERWKKLKGSLNLVISAVTACEQDRKLLVQGLRLNRKIKYSKDITDVQFLPSRQEYIIISGKKAQFLSEEGRKKNEHAFNFTNILHNMELKRFIGWTEDEYQLNLLTMRFEILHTVNCPDKIQHVAFNPCINELVSVCRNYLCVWIFQNGSKILVLKHKVKVTNSPTDTISGIVIQKSASRLQKCFLSRDVDVHVFQVRSAKFLLHKKDLHQRKISAMTFFNPFKILVTGSLDGCIKIWNYNWNVLMVFVSHENKITKLCPFPGTTAHLLSTSSDLTLRVWNLDAQEEVGRTEIEGDVRIFSCQPEKEVFHTCSGNALTIWTIEKLYHLHMSIGFQVTSIKVTSHPVYPQRAMVITSDLTIRLVMPHTAELITKLIIPAFGNLQIRDAVYAIAEEIIFVSLSDATILKASTKSHPCSVIDTWKYQDGKLKGFSCLILYEHVANNVKTEEMTSLMKSLTTQTVESGMLTTPKNTNRTILIGGTSNGQICVIDWQTGRPNIQIQAHNGSEVLSLVANVRFDQVISSGRDHVIKIWRFYPFAAECLVPLMSFYCTYTPTQLAVMKNLLCVAFEDRNTLNFSVVAYDLTNSERFDHSPEDDHLDNVVVFASCAKMNIFASASQDGTLKFWNETNNLIKTLHLVACPTSLCFHGDKGDLLVGIGFHLYHIPYKAYLPNSYRIKMLSLMLEEPMIDKPIPEDADKVKELEKFRRGPSQTIKRLPVYEDNLTKEEAEQLDLEKQQKAHAFKVFTDRENDLQLIKEGKYFSAKKAGPQQRKVRKEAFENYMKLIHDKIAVQLPEEPRFLNDDIYEKIHGPYIKKDYSEFTSSKPETIPGFFPDWRSAYTRPLPPGVKVQLPSNINPNGYLPNSVLIKLLWPDRNLKKQEDDRKQHDTELKKLFANLKYVAPQPVGKERSLSPPSPISKASPREETPIPEETPSPEPLSEATISVEETEIVEIVEELPPIDTAKAERVVVEEPEGSSVIKYVTRPRSSLAEVASSSTSPMLRICSATLSQEGETMSPVTEDYPVEIGKYQTTEWFKICFPQPKQDLPQPWNGENFVNSLLEVMPTTSTNNRSDILSAIMEVFLKYGSGDKEVIYETLTTTLKKDPLEMGCMQESERVFIRSALKNLYLCFQPKDDLVVYLVAYFVHGDRELKKIIMNSLKSMGMKDSSYYLSRELDTWDISHLRGKNVWQETLNKATLWLDQWKSRFVDHLKMSINLLKSGKNIHGHLSREQLTLAGKIHQKSVVMESQSVTVDVDLESRSSPVDKVTYIEVINYFCEMKMEATMMKKPKTPVKPLQEGIDKINSKNTVLMLPAVIKHKHLIRLGETHCSTCKPHRETTFYTDYRKPPVTCNGYLPHQLFKEEIRPRFHYYTPKVTLKPFPCSKSEWDPDMKDPVLVTLRIWPKYFIPAMSVVPSTT